MKRCIVHRCLLADRSEGADAACRSMTEDSQMNDYEATLCVSQTHCREITHARKQDKRMKHFFFPILLVLYVFTR